MLLSNSDRKYFAKARKIANVSDYPRVHIGAIAVYKGQIIGIGVNSNKTHPIQKYYNRYRNINNELFTPKIHAEISAINSIRHMNIDFAKVKLYIYRLCRDRPFGMARPCPSCLAAIKDIGIRHVYYTTDTGFIYEEVSNDL